MEFMLETRVLSSLEKVFPDEELRAQPFDRASALRGEVFAFQVALRATRNCHLTVGLQAGLPCEVREVIPVPCETPFLDHDAYMLRKTPGFFPDALLPLTANRMRLPENQWRAVWVSVRVPEGAPALCDEIVLTFQPLHHDLTVQEEIPPTFAKFVLEVLPAALPEQTLIVTHWFHADCIYTAHKVPCWSEEYWQLLEAYMRNLVRHGQTMLYTPLWTPPLDTEVGGERPTVQLLGIRKVGDCFEFDFSRLVRYLELARRCGVRQFEMAHPFTQWGARFTPKIIVEVDGVETKMFGWHVEATSELYRSFVRQLYPQLTQLLKDLGVAATTFFHVSDEPHDGMEESYRAALEIVQPYYKGFRTIDALSLFRYYELGLVETPIPCNDHIEAFKGRVPELWTYYCVSQYNRVPNRFFNMPSARNRVMGVMFYLYDIAGFLQWGYNFWYTQYSRDCTIDPWRVTDAGRGFPGGDAFLVYPGKDGPVDSLRHEVFHEGLQDLRALRALEAKIGRPAVLALLQRGLDYELTMTEYPRDAGWLLRLRSEVNHLLANS